MGIWTKAISAPLSINSALPNTPVYRLSAIARGGTMTLTGNASYQGMASSPLTISDGDGVVVENSIGNGGIDGLTITPTSSADVIIFM